MASYLSFGHDFYKYTNGDLWSKLETLDIPFKPKATKADLVVKLEKYAADIREIGGNIDKDEKDYLNRSFDPMKYTKPKLRQVLSHYGVAYGTNPDKPTLVNIFRKNLKYLRECNDAMDEDVDDETDSDQESDDDADARRHRTRRARRPSAFSVNDDSDGDDADPQYHDRGKGRRASRASRTYTPPKKGARVKTEHKSPPPRRASAPRGSRRDSTGSKSNGKSQDKDDDGEEEEEDDTEAVAKDILSVAKKAVARVYDGDRDRAVLLLEHLVTSLKL